MALANRGCSGQASSGITDGLTFAKPLTLCAINVVHLIQHTIHSILPTAYEQLDLVLKHFYDNKDVARALPEQKVKIDVLFRIAGNESELERMILKLRDDKYLQVYPDYENRLPDGRKDLKGGLVTHYSITFDGRLFLEQGGYAGLMKKDRLKNFPKNYWWIIALFAWTVGTVTDIGKEYIKKRFFGNETLNHTIKSKPNTSKNGNAHIDSAQNKYATP